MNIRRASFAKGWGSDREKTKLMKKIAFGLLCAGSLLTACETTENEENKVMTEIPNPFFGDYNTPFEVPPFDEIKNEHFKPAILKGIEEQQAEVLKIASSTRRPTFENTIEALELTGDLLGKVTAVFYNLNSARTNEEIQQISKDMAPELSAHDDFIYLNDALYKRVKAVYAERDELELTDEQLRLLNETHKKFVRKGADLAEVEKDRLKEINGKLSVLSLEFGQNVLAETNAYELVIDNEDDLSGLPQNLIDVAADDAENAGHEGKWVFTLHNPSLLPFLSYADNRELRKEIWEAYRTRCFEDNEHDNRPKIKEMVALRAQKAKLLGYDHHADYVLEKRMAGNIERVYDLLDEIWKPAAARAKEEAADIQKLIDAEGHDFELQPYDWRYYTEKIRAQRFDFDESEVKPYFSLGAVREGIFTVTNKLWGLTYKKIEDIPVYHPDVTAYEVFDKDESHLGVLYMDFHPRSSKRGGAWMTSFRTQTTENGERKAPVISIVCNFSKPGKNKPALLTFDEVTTFFHEFGHALHGLLSDVTYQSLAGTNVPTDFVELPSQVLENWAGDPEVMKMYAFHYETGEVIPDELINKLQEGATFNQGFATVEYLAASMLDLDYHSQTGALDKTVEEFEAESMQNIGLPAEIIPRYRSTYFNHIFAGGYSAGYYSYIWSGVLDSDAFAAFKETELFNQELAQKFRKNILERGGTREAMDMYVDFRGAEPDITPLLRKRGLLEKPTSLKDRELKK